MVWLPSVGGDNAHYLPIFDKQGEGSSSQFQGRGVGGSGFSSRKDLIAAMNNNNASKEKVKALSEKLKVEKLLVK